MFKSIVFSSDIEVNRVKRQKVEKILNKRKISEVIKYLVYWKRFTVENNT